ncbi:hypothetical protein ANO11243_008630 [Dothideomycetidae sp. 11243]|nr:hypothetical protein ANO11243_008630 [fungal sp. No.11243]
MQDHDDSRALAVVATPSSFEQLLSLNHHWLQSERARSLTDHSQWDATGVVPEKHGVETESYAGPWPSLALSGPPSNPLLGGKARTVPSSLHSVLHSIQFCHHSACCTLLQARRPSTRTAGSASLAPLMRRRSAALGEPLACASRRDE